MTISKATIEADVFSTFFTLINNGITNPHGTTKWIWSEMPDIEFYSNDFYPAIVLSPADFNEDTKFTFTSNKFLVDVLIDVMATSWASTDLYTEQVRNLIETSRATLRADGIKLLKASTIDKGTFERGGIKAHFRTVKVSFELNYTKTRGY